MGVFTKKESRTRKAYIDSYYGRIPEKHYEVRVPTKVGVVALSAVAFLGVYSLFTDRGGDILGDSNNLPEKTRDEITETYQPRAQAKYRKAYESAPPAGKFALEFLTTTDVQFDTDESNGNGIAGVVTENPDQDAIFTFNNGCLNKTAYDINGGEIEGLITGLFTGGYVSGEFPTAAAYAHVDSNDSNVLVVSSGHTDSIDLRFSGLAEGDHLEPLDNATIGILDTYGCETGITNVKIFQNSYGDKTSPWVKS